MNFFMTVANTVIQDRYCRLDTLREKNFVPEMKSRTPVFPEIKWGLFTVNTIRRKQLFNSLHSIVDNVVPENVLNQNTKTSLDK